MQFNWQHDDAQVEAFLNAIYRDAGGHADIQDVGNGEFIIDGVINVRAALDAALAVEADRSANAAKGGVQE